MAFKRLRGMHDIFGQDALGFQKVERFTRQVFGNFGFEEMRTPVLEEKELFSRALGTETDVVQKEMYEFTDRSQTQVALRPEGTAGVVRAYLENDLDKTQGLAKFYYLGPMFRSERPQAGRLRQFHQIGVEALGTDSAYSDAEVIQMLALFLDQIGASGYTLKLNNLGSFEDRAQFRKVLQKYFEPFQDKLCPDCKNRLTKNVFRLLDCKVSSCRVIVEKSPLISDFLSEASRAHFETTCQALKLANIPYAIDPYMVRGLDYYTKTVFEVTHPSLGAQDALAAGGRYDHLIESFGGPKLGAVGFAIGVERLLMCLKSEAIKEPNEKVFFMVTLGDNAFKEGFKILSLLRSHHFKVLMDFQAKSMKAQMRAADKSQAHYCLILGDNEIAKNIIVVKDMKNGEQKEMKLEEILNLKGTPDA